MGYFKSALIGTGWMGTLRLMTRGLGFIKTAILARILTPQDFGLFGIAAIALALMETFSETGVSLALVQQDEEIDEYINTAWVISILRGVLIALVLVVLAKSVTDFFHQPQAMSFILLMAFLPVIKGFINPAAVEFVKRLRFDKEFLLRSVPVLIEMGIAIPAAVMTRSATAIIFGMIGAALAEVILSFVMGRIRPRLAFSSTRATKVIRYGKWVTVGGILSWFSEQLDDILVGRFLGMTNLGIYQMAFKLAVLPSRELSGVFSKVVFPVYSKIAADKKRLRRAVVNTSKTMGVISLPIALILALFPHTVIRFTLGEAWLNAAPPLRILALYGFVIASTQAFSDMLYAVGRPNIAVNLRIIHVVALSTLIYPLLRSYQAVGAALAVVGSAVITLPFLVREVRLILRDRSSLGGVYAGKTQDGPKR